MVLNRRPFNFSFIFGNGKKSRCQVRGVRWVGANNSFVFRQKLVGEDGSVKRGDVMVKQPGLFSPKVGAMSSHFFTQSPQNFAVEPGIHSLARWVKFFMNNPHSRQRVMIMLLRLLLAWVTLGFFTGRIVAVSGS